MTDLMQRELGGEVGSVVASAADAAPRFRPSDQAELSGSSCRFAHQSTDAAQRHELILSAVFGGRA